MSGLLMIWGYGALTLACGVWLGTWLCRYRMLIERSKAQRMLETGRAMRRQAVGFLMQAQVLNAVGEARQARREEPEDPADWWKDAD